MKASLVGGSHRHPAEALQALGVLRVLGVRGVPGKPFCKNRSGGLQVDIFLHVLFSMC